jgi:hypothetical protein
MQYTRSHLFNAVYIKSFKAMWAFAITWRLLSVNFSHFNLLLETINLYRGPAIDASYQVSVHLAKWFQRRRFFQICLEIIKSAHFVAIHLQTWLPQTILVSDWLISKNKIFSSETAFLIEPKLGRKHLWKVLYKDCSFCPNRLANLPATGNSCFWLVDF